MTSIIGSGPLENVLKEKARALDLDIDWKGNLPNTELPQYLNRSKIFILPSHYEGHPKTLIEAMAAGAAVIGANVPGIREVIRHGENGWLCGTDPGNIRAAITALIDSEQLRLELGRNARAFALAHYSLDTIAESELGLLETLRRRQGSRDN